MRCPICMRHACSCGPGDWHREVSASFNAAARWEREDRSLPNPGKPTRDGLVDREVIARVIDPEAWDEISAEDNEEVAAIFAEAWEDALAKADEIITLLGGRSDSSAQSQPVAAYTVEDAKRDAAKGDLSGLTELAELWAYEKKRARGWFLTAKAMGYEGDGTYDTSELGSFVLGQIEKSRVRVAMRVLENALDPKSTLHGAHTEDGGAGS